MSYNEKALPNPTVWRGPCPAGAVTGRGLGRSTGPKARSGAGNAAVIRRGASPAILLSPSILPETIEQQLKTRWPRYAKPPHLKFAVFSGHRPKLFKKAVRTPYPREHHP